MKNLNPRIKVILILMIALCALLVYAVIPNEISIRNFSLLKIDISTIQAAETQVAADKTVTVTKHKITAAKNPDTTRQTILFIGDSMLEGLTRRFCDYAAENGHKLYTVIWYSSGTQLWGETRTIEHYINKYHPTFIVICTGSNELFVRDLKKRDVYIQKIVKKFGKIPFVWISPPNWKNDTGINNLIIKDVGTSRYFDSRHLKLERGKDHAHPTFSAAAIWMDKIATWMCSNSTAHPIMMKAPKKKVNSRNVTVLSPNFRGFK